MNVAVYSTRPYERAPLERANAGAGRQLAFLEPRLTRETAPLANVTAFENGSWCRPRHLRAAMILVRR